MPTFSDPSRRVPVAVLLVAVLIAAAVGAATAVAVSRGPWGAGGPAPAGDFEAAVQQLSQRLERLERREPLVGRGPAAPVLVAAGGEVTREEGERDGDTVRRVPLGDGGAALARLDARLSLLERERQERLDESARREREKAVRQAEDERRRQESTVSARETILDASASIADKSQAWRRLRSGGWTDAVVQEMVRLAQSSTDPAFRADVWRQADARERNLLLVPPLLQALGQDAEAAVREEAAETLENYLDQPGVRQVLETAARSDPDADVRRQAQAVLSSGRR
jgi:hypothetical protein